MERANDKSSDGEHQEAAKAPTAPDDHQRSGDVGSALDDAPPAELTRAPGQVSLNEELEFLSPTSAATDPIARGRMSFSTTSSGDESPSGGSGANSLQRASEMAERRRNRRAGLRGAAPPGAFHAPANGNGPSGSAAITPAALSAPPVSIDGTSSSIRISISRIANQAARKHQKTNLHWTFWEGPTSFFSLTWLGIQSLAGPTVSEHSP